MGYSITTTIIKNEEDEIIVKARVECDDANVFEAHGSNVNDKLSAENQVERAEEIAVNRALKLAKINE